MPLNDVMLKFFKYFAFFAFILTTTTKIKTYSERVNPHNYATPVNGSSDIITDRLPFHLVISRSLVRIWCGMECHNVYFTSEWAEKLVFKKWNFRITCRRWRLVFPTIVLAFEFKMNFTFIIPHKTATV